MHFGRGRDETKQDGFLALWIVGVLKIYLEDSSAIDLL